MTDDKEIVVLTGKEAVGKSSLIDYLVVNGENKILKLTTRRRAATRPTERTTGL